MKRAMALILSAAMLTGFATGCGKTASDDKETSNAEILNFTEPEVGEKIVCLNIEGYGEIKIKLFADLLPDACENFLTLTEDGFYDELIFHRVISNFMIQGGDPKGNGTGGRSCWGGEFDGGVSENLIHVRGAVAYANSGGTDTDTSQFYIVTEGPVEADLLDAYEEDGYGPYSDEAKELYTTVGGSPHLDGNYTVFGQVIEGLDIAVDIADNTATDSNDKPRSAIRISSATVEEYDGSGVHFYVED